MKPYTNISVYKETMKKALDLELSEQSNQVKTAYQSLSELKKSGYGIYPLIIVNQTYGVGEYPEITFKVPLNQSTEKFRNQDTIELFSNENFVKGSIIYLNATDGKIRLYADEFPDWLDEKTIGIRVGVDEKSMLLAQKAIEQLNESNPFASYLFSNKLLKSNNSNFAFQPSANLNESQNKAVQHILSDNPISIVHGPPGTGKTTTLVNAIEQLVKQGEKVYAVAPSNMAVDHLSQSLINQGVNVLRMGNPSKVSEQLMQHTIDGKLTNGTVFQELKKLKIRAEEYRKMASQYKRKFGKEEANQRKLIWNEYRSLKKEIQNTIGFYKEKWIDEAHVICGTPVGLSEEIAKANAKIIVIDEAGQCLQPLAWLVLQPFVEKVVLAGDHFQLPPTVISDEATKCGLSQSILDLFLTKSEPILLNMQYRMQEKIVGFSNAYFYKNKIQTAVKQLNNEEQILFYDTAGTGFEEEREQDGSSFFNSGELNLITQIVNQLDLNPQEIALISPYSGQVAKAKDLELPFSRITSIDSFQGQENQIIILSLVRSNDRQEIGFLKDYRRMNVAMTRAKEKLIIIGDSATIGNDDFYRQFLDYAEKHGAYRTAWEVF
ncbi:MAG TPA: AAA domain-containing protein [Crocinitomicaceae bacterium]|nr:AAA domain-containing protein [Crocinitomicaceae bacterium]